MRQNLAGEVTATAGQELATSTGPTLWAWADLLGLGGVLSWLNEHPLLSGGVGLVLLAVVAWAALRVVRRYLLRLITILVRHSPTSWDEVLLDRDLFHRLAWAVPVFLIYQGISLVPYLPSGVEILVKRLTVASLAIIAVRVFSSLLAAANEIYNRYPLAATRPIKGYLQVVSIVAYALAAIFVIATLMDRSPLIFFSGLGAMTAILLLIFRDTLLSLVAGIQLTGNNLIRVGDWIEMPQFGADGDVIDIALNSVRVQNWDRTITVIPTHKFLEHSFKNWRGMQDSGGRRIKRSFNIDMSTIRFLDDAEIERFRRFVLLNDYVEEKVAAIEEYNRTQCAEPGLTANARRMTNIGMLRAYIVNYLREHPKIHQQMTFLVRQLQPTAEGLPLEVYVFANDTAWANYEAIQADVFDHILAIVPEFGLRVYQAPSGSDLARAGASIRAGIRAPGAGDGERPRVRPSPMQPA